MSTELDAVIAERDRLREENARLVEMLAWCQTLLGKAGEPPQQMVCDGCGVFGPTCPTEILARIMSRAHGWGATKDGSDFCPDCRAKPSPEPCGATEWAHCDDGSAHVYRICDEPKDHGGRWHSETRDGKLWAESSGDDGPVTLPLCEHMGYRR